MLKGYEDVTEEKIIKQFFEWSPRKQGYTDSQILSSIEWFKRHDFVPTGFGYLIKEAKKKKVV